MHVAKAALDRAASIVNARPEIGQRTYTATATVVDGMVCRVAEKGHELVTDMPCSMGGGGSGPTPSALLRAAMASCAAIGVKMWAARAGMQIDRVDVRFETDVDARGQLGLGDSIAPGFERGRLSIEVLSREDASRVREIVRQSLKHGPMMDAIRCTEPVQVSVSVIESQPGGAR